MHTFLSRRLCRSRLTCSFVFTNPFSHAHSIPLIFFPLHFPLNTSQHDLFGIYPPRHPPSPPSPQSPPYFSHYLPPSLMISQRLPIGKFMRLIISTRAAGFSKMSHLSSPLFFGFLLSPPLFLFFSLRSTALLCGGALCGALGPASKTMKPDHLTCTGLNSQEERAGGYRRAGGREESGAASEPNTNKEQHPGKKEEYKKEKEQGKDDTLCNKMTI